MTISERDAALITEWAANLHKPVKLTHYTHALERNELLKTFCEEFQGLAPAVQVKRAPADGTPAIGITENIRYEAVPAKGELPPFLDALKAVAHAENAVSQSVKSTLNRVRAPAVVRLYMSIECPHCPKTVARLLPLALACGSIHMTVTDGSLFPEKASADKVRSVPTVILDGDFRWTGAVETDEFLNALVNRDPSQLSAATLQTMLGDGRAEQLAGLMAENGAVFPAFLDLLTHEKWPIRLGAMAAFEYLLEKDRSLSVRVLDGAWERFPQCDDAIKGDLIYLTAESGDKNRRDRLQALASGSESLEVREAASEALGVIMAENT